MFSGTKVENARRLLLGAIEVPESIKQAGPLISRHENSIFAHGHRT